MQIRASESLRKEVVFEGAIKGEGLAIALSQGDAATAVRWIILVEVHLAQGWFLLGFFTTNTPAVDGATSRVVGFASCPGARGWKVSAEPSVVQPGNNAGIDDELTLQAGLCCGGGSAYGVFVPPQPPGSGGAGGGGT